MAETWCDLGENSEQNYHALNNFLWDLSINKKTENIALLHSSPEGGL
jgi:hypothetical protein